MNIKAGSDPYRFVTFVGVRNDSHMEYGKRDSVAFSRDLRRLAYELGAVGIVEEAPPDFVAFVKPAKTSPELVAQELALRYLQVELTEAERNELGIVIGFQQGQTEEWVTEQKTKSLHVREAGWLERLLEADVFPAILICDASHIGTFSDKLVASGVEVTVSHTDWSPSP